MVVGRHCPPAADWGWYYGTWSKCRRAWCYPKRLCWLACDPMSVAHMGFAEVKGVEVGRAVGLRVVRFFFVDFHLGLDWKSKVGHMDLAPKPLVLHRAGAAGSQARKTFGKNRNGPYHIAKKAS